MTIKILPKDKHLAAGTALSRQMDSAEVTLYVEPMCEHGLTKWTFELLPLVGLHVFVIARLAV